MLAATLGLEDDVQCVVVAAMLLAVGPVIDPIEGEHLTGEDRDVLPAARHLGAMADLWMVQVVNMQSSGGGIDLFDPLYLSAHGRGWSQLTYKIGGIDQTDPARPGNPLFDVPHLAWDGVDFKSMWTDAPGFVWRLDLDAADVPTARVTGSFGGDVGGGAWVPNNLFDRDPAFAFGAPTTRRALHMARELLASTRLPTPWGPTRIFAEVLAHDHHYLTLPPPDLADRSTVMLSTRVNAAPWPTEIFVGWQTRHRGYDGAQFRWPQAFTQSTKGQAWVGQLQSCGTLPDQSRWQLALGMGWRKDQATAHGDAPWVQDLADAWTYQTRPTYPEAVQRWHLGGEAAWQTGPERAPLRVTLKGRLAEVQRTPEVIGGRDGVTYAGQAVRQTIYAPMRTETVWLRNVRLGADWTLPVDALWLQVTGGIDFSAVGTPKEMRLGQVGPALGVAARWPVGGGELFGLLRREPESLTAQVADFLSPDTPSGETTFWQDNDANLMPSDNERGVAVGRTGGAYHEVDGHLTRPSSNGFAVGYRTPVFGPFRFTVSGVGRWLLERYTVNQTSVPSTRLTFHDPGGDGRGEVRPPSGGQDLEVSAQAPADLAQANYILQNDDKLAYYLGLEMDLVSESGRFWFLNLGTTAYLSAGRAPFGNGPDRNDPSVVNEASAGPNNAAKAWSRYDHDRSFAIKILAGVKPVEGLSLALAARYRDGEPFTRIVIDPSLPQGPTALMAIRRGGARYTFHMTWDVRVRYVAKQFAPLYAAVWADVFNVFGSATELLEDPRTGPTYRRSTEAVPGRAALINLELGWM